MFGWLALELTKLGVEDEQALIPYVLGILESGGSVDEAVDSVSPFFGDCDETAIFAFTASLEAEWTAEQGKKKKEEDEAAVLSSSLNALSLPEAPVIAAAASATKPPTVIISQADKEATLRMARQISDKERRQFDASVAAATSSAEPAASEVLGNRSAVQARLQQAQQARETEAKAKQTQSKSAEADDRKDKEQRKLDRQKRAQKGERRA